MNYKSINKKLWNDRVANHMASEFYDNASFIAGRNSLNGIELELLGDVTNQSIAHLQCHFGQDSMSLARMGAKVTGIDFSDQAISQAKQLNAQLGLSAEFYCDDILALFSDPAAAHLAGQFDVVFASYGVLGWHPDVAAWMSTARQLLKPGGRLVLVEFHPVLWMFDERFQQFKYSYFNRGPITEQVSNSYTDGSATEQNYQEVGWNHSFADIFAALLDQGLHVQSFTEYDYSPYPCFDNMQPCEQGYRFTHLGGIVPMVYGLVARLTTDA
ncbi:MAG: class I SAM-dependent methyltransferase [Gammaproteobacteria bacterium]|nr:class I SAM-dependent methyltransferase [Gammaproteobacteria bacterium]NVK89219.1 class I SAM-dependent methyltransferase [Gammaproteobacteria bacterium]